MLVLVPEAMLTGGALEHRYHRISMLLAGSHLYMFTRFLQEKNTRNQREREREINLTIHMLSPLCQNFYFTKKISPLIPCSSTDGTARSHFHRRHSTPGRRQALF